MNILVINCGSSSIRLSVIEPGRATAIKTAHLQDIGTAVTKLKLDGGPPQALPGMDHKAAMQLLLEHLQPCMDTVVAVGHRVVHGGSRFVQPARIDDDLIAGITEVSALAPLHNAACLAGITDAYALLPDLPQVAVFDTAFHSSLPTRARIYALPRDVTEAMGIRRFGFHGISHESVALQAAHFLQTDVRELRIVSCHLGSGCSVAAIENGRSIETSMGMTPLEGLVMGTRCGDLDAGVIFEIQRQMHLSTAQVEDLLNRKSGLLGMTGTQNMSEIEQRAAEGDEAARLAIHVFCHRIRKYVGAYVAVMGGADAIVFTGGIGENSALVRHRVAQRLDFLGARIDEDRNRDATVSTGSPVVEFSQANSRTRLFVVASNEAGLIAKYTAETVFGQADRVRELQVPVAVSARHVHLTQETIERLFGEGYKLTEKHPLSQPGQYAAHESVTLVGPKNSIERVRVLGPPRAYNQVEISRSDEFALGIDAPVRISGDIDNTPGISLIGPHAQVQLDRGVICAKRHIHMQPEDATAWGVQHGDSVDIAIDSDGRDLVFNDVVIRVSPKFQLEMHIDTDEANAAGLGNGDKGVLVPTQARARLRNG
jgi:acetate kinase